MATWEISIVSRRIGHMDLEVRLQVRLYVMQRLGMKGDDASVSNEGSLFLSGRLESIDAVEIIMYLEDEFGISFAEISFDLTLLDSIDSIAELVSRCRRGPDRS